MSEKENEILIIQTPKLLMGFLSHFIGKLSSYSVFGTLVHVSYGFVFVLLGSDRACLNTSISC